MRTAKFAFAICLSSWRRRPTGSASWHTWRGISSRSRYSSSVVSSSSYAYPKKAKQSVGYLANSSCKRKILVFSSTACHRQLSSKSSKTSPIRASPATRQLSRSVPKEKESSSWTPTTRWPKCKRNSRSVVCPSSMMEILGKLPFIKTNSSLLKMKMDSS